MPVIPEIRLVPDNTAAKTVSEFPDESPCFHIAHIGIQGCNIFPHWFPFPSFFGEPENFCETAVKCHSDELMLAD
ncbi:hypothetical protein OD522_004883 [Salmonella enterica]|nr:hypothetical protein [Salmonella enterica]EJA5857496.1 hypothetical protein [Salmonella enterica]EJF5731567.1 hypothetical protein [Salmonella enterica]EJU3354133.1 hypothetical protein [Salmonella enterica]EJX4304642.1 hypothetical protein [Salmonella enterica]